MILVAVIERELRIAARSPRMYWSRFFAGATALALALYFVWLARELNGAAGAGGFVLRFAAYAALTLSLFTGVNRTADCLSSEKREDTLGLLFLTHLKARDIIAGKLLAHSVRAVLNLIGIVPILSFPVLLGGVSGVELFRLPLALLNSLFLALSFGMLISALVKKQSTARALGIAGMVLIGLALPGFAMDIVRRIWNQPLLALVLCIPSPLYALEMSFGSAVGLSTNLFWIALAVQFSLACGALLGAGLVLPRTWRIAESGPFLHRWRMRLDQWFLGTPEIRAKRRRRLLRGNPIYWLNSRDRFGAVKPALFALVLLGLTVWCIVHYEIPEEPAFLLLFFALAINDLAMRFRVAGLAATRLAQDRQSGALEMILSTPITIREIVNGLWRTIRRQLLWTYIPSLLLFWWLDVQFHLRVNSGGDGAELFVIAVSIGDFIVTGYVAVWKAMRVFNPAHASGAAISRVLLLPWGIWFGLLPLIGEVSALKGFFQEHEPYSFLISAALIWTSSSIVALIHARRNTRLHFREAATDRYAFEQKVSMIRRLGAIWRRISGRKRVFSSLPRPLALTRP